MARYVAELENERIMILRIIIGVVVGGGLGFAYYKFVGCSTGTCPLTSNPFLSSIYGSILRVGWLGTGLAKLARPPGCLGPCPAL